MKIETIMKYVNTFLFFSLYSIILVIFSYIFVFLFIYDFNGVEFESKYNSIDLKELKMKNIEVLPSSYNEYWNNYANASFWGFKNPEINEKDSIFNVYSGYLMFRGQKYNGEIEYFVIDDETYEKTIVFSWMTPLKYLIFQYIKLIFIILLTFYISFYLTTKVYKNIDVFKPKIITFLIFCICNSLIYKPFVKYLYFITLSYFDYQPF